MLILAELNFAQTVTAGFLNALFTAGLVGISAVLVVKSFEKRWEEQRQVRQLRVSDEDRAP